MSYVVIQTDIGIDGNKLDYCDNTVLGIYKDFESAKVKMAVEVTKTIERQYYVRQTDNYALFYNGDSYYKKYVIEYIRD